MNEQRASSFYNHGLQYDCEPGITPDSGVHHTPTQQQYKQGYSNSAPASEEYFKNYPHRPRTPQSIPPCQPSSQQFHSLSQSHGNQHFAPYHVDQQLHQPIPQRLDGLDKYLSSQQSYNNQPPVHIDSSLSNTIHQPSYDFMSSRQSSTQGASSSLTDQWNSPPTPPTRSKYYDNKTEKRRGQRAAHACNHCRLLKARCDEGKPSCKSCTFNGNECVYTGGVIRKPKEASADLDSRFEKLSTELTGMLNDMKEELLKRLDDMAPRMEMKKRKMESDEGERAVRLKRLSEEDGVEEDRSAMMGHTQQIADGGLKDVRNPSRKRQKIERGSDAIQSVEEIGFSAGVLEGVETEQKGARDLRW